MTDIEKVEASIQGDDPWIETYTGKRFYLAHDDNEDQIDIIDIGHALGMNCRYNGHCRSFYSVAEHSVLMSYLVSPENAMQALLHDSTEAYLSDICRPFKKHLHNYAELENTLYARIARKFGLPEKLHPEVKHYDVAICRLEGDRLMPSRAEEWGIPKDALTIEEFRAKTGHVHIPCWEWREARDNFLLRFSELSR